MELISGLKIWEHIFFQLSGFDLFGHPVSDFGPCLNYVITHYGIQPSFVLIHLDRWQTNCIFLKVGPPLWSTFQSSLYMLTPQSLYLSINVPPCFLSRPIVCNLSVMVQIVERALSNPKVPSSNPGHGTMRQLSCIKQDQIDKNFTHYILMRIRIISC